MPEKPTKICVLSGGVGAAKFLRGLCALDDELDITAIVNTGDDMVHCGLHISPDIDTIIYTLSGKINKKTGWGLQNETWNAMASLQKLEEGLEAKENVSGWFNLGDFDIGTHLYRTSRLNDNIPLSQITQELANQFGINIQILPMTDDPVRTKIKLADSGDEISFQEYFVKLRHDVVVQNVGFEGAEKAAPATGVIEALESADKIIIAPSNPILSISPILAIPEIARTVQKRRKDAVFISPIIAGKALKGPADRIMFELGFIPDAAGVANFYSDYVDNAIIDVQDSNLISAIQEIGLKCLALDTIMSNKKSSKQLAQSLFDFMR